MQADLGRPTRVQLKCRISGQSLHTPARGALCTHPAVSDAAVIPVEDTTAGELPRVVAMDLGADRTRCVRVGGIRIVCVHKRGRR